MTPELSRDLSACLAEVAQHRGTIQQKRFGLIWSEIQLAEDAGGMDVLRDSLPKQTQTVSAPGFLFKVIN